ncbi:MAG: AsmA family protein [Gammaproteobacteria bacterium]
MGKLFKILGAIVGVIVVLIIAAIIIIPLVVDPNDFKDKIAASVKESTGRTLSINEDIGLSVFPWLALEVKKAELSNPEGFEQGTFARIGEASIRVKLQPLLSRQLEMDTLVLNDVELNLIRQQDGSDNFSQWGKASADKAGESAPSQDQGKEGDAQQLAGLTIGGVKVSQLNVRFDDRQAGQKIELLETSLESGAITPGEAIPIKLSALLTASAPATKAQIELSTQALLDQAKGLLTLSGLELTVDAEGEAVPGGKMDLSLLSEVKAALDGSSAQLDKLELKTLGLRLTGNARATDLSSEPRFSGKITLDETNPKELLTKLGNEPLQTVDPEALTALGLESEFAGTTQSLKLDQLAMKLDETQFDGYIHINDFNGPNVSFKLNGNRLDVDRYMVKTAEGQAGSDGANEGKQAEAEAVPPALPLDVLRALVLNGDLRLKWFKVNNLKAENVSLSLRAKGGKLAVEPLAANFYQGQVEQIVRLDVRKDTPVIQAITQLNEVQAEPLLMDLNGEALLSGTMNLSGDVTTQGLDAKTATRNLGGTAKFEFLDGAYNGVNIGYELRRAKALIKGEKAPEEGAKKTDFAELSGSANIKGGVVHNNDLLMKAPLLRLQGKGNADLNQSVMDYALTVAVVETSKGQGGGSLDELRGLKIPVSAKGPFADPKIGIELEKLISESAKAKVKEKAKEKVEEVKAKAKEKVEKKIQEKLGDKVGQELGNKLKGLFGN